jgi:hypothetical protein
VAVSHGAMHLAEDGRALLHARTGSAQSAPVKDLGGAACGQKHVFGGEAGADGARGRNVDVMH